MKVVVLQQIVLKNGQMRTTLLLTSVYNLPIDKLQIPLQLRMYGKSKGRTEVVIAICTGMLKFTMLLPTKILPRLPDKSYLFFRQNTVWQGRLLILCLYF